MKSSLIRYYTYYKTKVLETNNRNIFMEDTIDMGRYGQACSAYQYDRDTEILLWISIGAMHPQVLSMVEGLNDNGRLELWKIILT